MSDAKMRKIRSMPAAAGLLALFAALGTAQQSPPEKAVKPAVSRDDSAAEKLGWRLGTQAWTFRDRTTFEAIDAARRLGIKYMELYPGQKMSPETGDVKVGLDMGAENLAALKKKLADAGVKAVSFGVLNLKNDEAECRRFFEFGRSLGLENLSAEPEPDSFALLDKLVAEYGLKIAIHNHPKDSRYWDPDVVLKAIAGHDPRIGACADTGHWPRSGLVALDCLKKLSGHVIELHFKDLNDFGRKDAIDVPWGTGKSDARAMLLELKRQGFRGLISLEYEDGSGAVLEQNAAKCVAFFDQVAREAVGTASSGPGR